MEQMDKILLFIPMYNCQEQITRVLEQLDGKIMNYIAQVLVVDNQSTDQSREKVIEYFQSSGSHINGILVKNRNNYSLGGSHKVAFSYGISQEFDYVIVLHGDDQGNILDLYAYLKSKDYRKYDSFLGSRFLKNSKLINYSAIRIIGNHIFNVGLSIVTRRRITDLGSGLNLYKVSYLEDKFYERFPNTLTFNVYMLLYGIYSKSKFAFFPLTWKEEDQISNAKFLKQSFEIFDLVRQYIFDKNLLFLKKANEYSCIAYEYDVLYQTKLKEC